MIDVSPKFNTLRYAMARGTLYARPESIARVLDRTVPKGDVLEVARAAGINAAKRCSDWMVFCHNIPLDWIELKFEFEQDRIKVFGEAKAIWKTGVEMEALSAVTGALLNMYDMLKPLDEELSFGQVKLVKKKGGKSDFQEGFPQALKTAVLIISSAVYSGNKEDRAGKIIKDFLETQPLEMVVYEILPEDQAAIRSRLTRLIDEENIDLVFTSGGSGPASQDVTPEAIRAVIETEIPGIAETMRRYGGERVPYAMLSRQVCGRRRQSLIVALPGSSKGALQSLQALFPGLLRAFFMLRKG